MENTLKGEWHKKSLGEIIDLLDTDIDLGLSTAKVANILEKNGFNSMPIPTGSGKYFAWIGCTTFAFLVTVILCFTSIFFPDRLVIETHPKYYYMHLGLVLIVGGIIMITFRLCLANMVAKVVSNICHTYPRYTTVVRSGVKIQENTRQVALGEMVLLHNGDLVPADMRLVQTTPDLLLDEFALTGDHEPSRKDANACAEDMRHSPNMAWSGSYCVKGCGRGIVVGTGASTRLSGLKSSKVYHNLLRSSPLFREMRLFIRSLHVFAWIFGGVLFVASVMEGVHWYWALIYLLTLSIAIMPDFLLSGVTVGQFDGFRQTSGVQNEFGEGLGNCGDFGIDVIDLLQQSEISYGRFTDSAQDMGCAQVTATVITSQIAKTLTETQGTTYQNSAVMKFFFSPDVASSRTINISPGSTFSDSKTIWNLLCRTLYLTCAFDLKDRDFLRKSDDDRIDEALCGFLGEIPIEDLRLSKKYRKIFELPFDSERKFHLCIHEEYDEEERVHVVSLKGAPEVIIKFCNFIATSEKEEWISEPLSMAFNEVLMKVLSTGEKVIGVCYRKLYKKQTLEEYNWENVQKLLKFFRLVALVSLHDPVRFDARDTVEKCRKAGIKVTLVTGDHPIPAKWFAREVGIISPTSETRDELIYRLQISEDEVPPGSVPALVIHGNELRTINCEMLNDLLASYEEIVFARVTPRQKRSIVLAFQRQNMSVAMTGISPQDAPAMQMANIGIAMDRTSCELCKKAANLILLDNYFSTVLTAIEEGRLIFENLRKSIIYVLACKIPQAIPYVLYLSVKIPLPLGEIYILLIFLLTDVFPAIALLYEKPETSILMNFPRYDRKERLISKTFVRNISSKSFGLFGITETMAGLFTYHIIMAENGFMPKDLLGLCDKWDSPAINDLRDSYNQEWTYTARQQLKNACQTGFFAAIVVIQMFALIICRTNMDSAWTLGMRNYIVNFSLVFQVLLALLLIYLPGTDFFFSIAAIKFIWWLPGVPFGFYLFAFEELRSFLIRHSKPGTWLEQNTF